MQNTWIENLDQDKLAPVLEMHGDRLRDRYHTDDVHFAFWMHSLNRVVQSRVGISFDDLEDWDYWSAYEGDMNPRDAALEMLEDAGWETGEEDW